MTTHTSKLSKLLACTIGVYSLSSCGWVDSTGTQVNETTGVAQLSINQPLEAVENTALIAELEGEGSSLRNWTWTLNNKNEINRCAGMNGFDINHAQTTIADACTTQTECTIGISESDSNGDTRFNIRIPELKSPMAISYSLTTPNVDGDALSRSQLICAVPINEAPQAVDDSYIARGNNTLIVKATDSNNLLSNDLDDIDFRNLPLHIAITPVRAPLYATQFRLNSNGGFTYQAMADAPVNSSGHTEDSFEYAVSDGIHTASAIVSITTVGSNELPVQLQQIPDIVFSAADGLTDAHVRQIDLSGYFMDPDGDNLTFLSGDFGSALGLTLSEQGVIQADASTQDVNQWRATVRVSDGLESTEATFVVTVRIPDSIKNLADNKQPTATDIKNMRFSGIVRYDVSAAFSDPDEDDQLTYSARGLPAGFQIRADGVIEGLVDASNQGRWFVRVIAEDGYGGSATDGFNLILN